MRPARHPYSMSLLTDLDAFYTEHRRGGGLDGDVEVEIVWMACDYGARIALRVDVNGERQPTRADPLT